jgi:hypothetical protein
MVFLPSVPGIYAITFTATGEQYVGASRNVGARVRAHFRSLQGQPSPWVSRLAERIAASEGVTVGQALGRIDGALDAELLQAMPGADHDEIAAAETLWMQRLRPALNDPSCGAGRFAAKPRGQRGSVDWVAVTEHLRQLRLELERRIEG